MIASIACGFDELSMNLMSNYKRKQDYSKWGFQRISNLVTPTIVQMPQVDRKQ